MSKIWIEVAVPLLYYLIEKIWPSEKLSTWLLSSGQDFGKKFLDSKHVLKVYLKTSRKSQIFLFLPLSSVLVWLRIPHLRGIDIIKMIYNVHLQPTIYAYFGMFLQAFPHCSDRNTNHKMLDLCLVHYFGLHNNLSTKNMRHTMHHCCLFF